MARERDVVLVRHGETEWSASGRHTGRTDIPLTDQGRAQGRALAPMLRQWQFALTLTSPLVRAAETCRLAGLAGVPEPDLQEWDYGDFEGRTTPDIRTEVPEWTVWRGPIPGGEPIGDVAARAGRVIGRIDETEGDVALVSHGHFLRVFTACWLQLPPDHGRMFVLDTATCSVLTTERGSRAMRLWNGVPPAEDQPRK